MKVSMSEKAGLGILITVWLGWGVNAIGDLLVSPKPIKTAVFPAGGEAKAAPAAEGSAAPATDAAGALTMLASADAAAGEKAFKKCKACHSTANGAKHKIGPNLWDIVGRAKASAAGYKFSGALADLGGDWNYQDLDGFLANPKGFANGTKMSFSGIKKADVRAALIVYLRSLSDQPKPLP